MKRIAQFNDQNAELKINKYANTIEIRIDDQSHVFSCQATSSGWILQKDGHVFHTNTLTQNDKGQYKVMVNDQTLALTLEDPYALGDDAGGGAQAGEVTAVMPGRVLTIHVQPGDVVEQGQALLVLEAMKMENVIKASVAGSVASVDVAQGDSVESGQKMISIDVT